VAAAGAMLNPFLVAMMAALGSAIGELTGYAVGMGGSRLIKKDKTFRKMNIWFNKHLGFLIIFIFAATPLPDDVVGLFCGAVKYDIKKFFLATLAGKFILSLALAYAGFYGADFIVKMLA
jgi:membrane protein YqaA with SNARE-associated domain